MNHLFDMYTYLISTPDKKHIHAGYCKDVRKMVDWYNMLNEMSPLAVSDTKLNTLVYLEENATEGKAIDRMSYFTFMPLSERIKQVEAVNPDWIDLTTASNFNF